jgi:hypothetical protein
MGEWSKKVVELGEEIAAEFLRLIGWTSAQKGVALPCIRPEPHKVNNGERRTHGIDYLLAHASPLVDGVAQNLVVSVKYSATPILTWTISSAPRPSLPTSADIRLKALVVSTLAWSSNCAHDPSPARQRGLPGGAEKPTTDLG